MSLQNSVEVVQEIIARPDFTLDIPMVRSVFERAIIQAHGLAWFNRDLRTLSTEIGGAETSRTIPLPEKFRKLHTIFLLDNDGELLADTFEQGRLHRRPSQNYGLVTPNYYIALGDELRIYWGHADKQGSLDVLYYAFPTISFNDEEGEWESDSWILENYSTVVEYHAAKVLAGNTESSQFQVLANLAEEAEFNLLNDAAFIGTNADMRS